MSADSDDHGEPLPPKKSFGNMGPDHWSRAPGVAEGGAERNHYCMHCAGVIPFDPALKACPHCKEPIEGGVRRYFNWVEMNEPPKSDVGALLVLGAGLGTITVLIGAALWWFSR